MKVDVKFTESDSTFGVKFSEKKEQLGVQFSSFQKGGGGGENGATFIPSVSSDGVISWTNDKELPNPTPVNVKGKDGKTPVKGVDYFDGKNGKDGQDGYTPVKGVDYFDGKDGEDGYTPVKGKDYFDGKDGKDGYTPIKGVDYVDGKNGKDGKDGVTPVKGTDYFTDADKAEMVSAVIAQLPVYGGEVAIV